LVRRWWKINNKQEIHEKYLDDVALEISQDCMWRKKLFGGQYNEKFLITYKMLSDVPKYLKNAFELHELEYYVSKIFFLPGKI
jgi:hypothetical protein